MSEGTIANRSGAVMALTMSTLAFSFCFACWVINAVLVTFLVSTGEYAFSESQVGWLLAVPILTGAVSRLPLGMLTDQLGGRKVFSVLMLVIAIPMFLLSRADSYAGFLLASMGFGLAGGSFAVGIGYVSSWFDKERQGTAMGIFGAGNAGAAATTILAPQVLKILTEDGANLAAWRQLPQLYAGLLVVVALIFFLSTRERRVERRRLSMAEQLAPLKSIIVWRFGIYYFLVFGAFVSLAQWIIPYSVNVYEMTVIQAGLLAALFSLPSGVIRAAGGWLSDYFGPRTVMYWVFWACLLSCLVAAVPRMDVRSPGEGVTSRQIGEVTEVSAEQISIGNQSYALASPPQKLPAEMDDGTMFLPRIIRWHEPVVEPGDPVIKKQLLARGISNLYYPSNVWIFAAMLLVFGVATGIGKAGVYRFIPDQFPDQVGVVGGMVGLIGAMGGFVLPPLFGYLLQATGLWTTCWMVLAVLSLACLGWMHLVVRRIMADEAPDLAQLMERRPAHAIGHRVRTEAEQSVEQLEDLLRRVPFFADLHEEELKEIAEIGGRREVESGKPVFRSGDPGNSLYIILEGSVQILGRDEEDKAVELACLVPGAYFGELALIDSEPRSADAMAVADCKFFLIERTPFLKLLGRVPHLLADILVGMSGKIRENNIKLYDAFMRQERLRSEQEIDRHRSIGEMVAGVAHELNTPIGIVNHAASIISEHLGPEQVEQLASDEAAAESLGDLSQAARLIQNNIARANHLIQSFKHLSVSNVSDQLEPVDLIDLTKEVLELYQLKARESHLEVTLDERIEPEQRQWFGFAGYYSQVVLNLLTNAHLHGYGGGKGKVEVKVERDGDQFQLVFTDRGKGIPENELGRVFEPFYTTGRESGGTGLGLSIVQNLVTGPLQGRIQIESSPGEGTRVGVNFPVTLTPVQGED